MRFAALVSTSPTDRAAALADLDHALQALEPTALIRLIVGLERALDPTPGGYRRSMVVDRDDRAIACAVARGFDAVRDWPVRLRGRLEELTGDTASSIDRRELQSRIRSVGGYRLARHPAIRRDCVGWRRDDVLERWDELVASILNERERPRHRRVLPAALEPGHAELALDRLKSSSACAAKVV